MRRALRADSQVAVWFVLVAATAMTAVLGLEQASTGTVAAGLALLGIALVKARLVGIHFMELGNAPLSLRLMFEGYVVLVGLTLAVLYLVV